ncbi:YqcC family protein [Pseudomonas sp. DTU_2021_1001937_2_SI_NGA_ILE_001]|uniref:YqcC family protein n=1 Tax=Pseudomonas sp. DTU_2021_1001937_2_SI_NGA_ILE_001 TaxID=3077589 RepID=UPI0025FCBEF6|nr:YqcC family protein [Pseudomonas sp. DTU_2021_1001937_2_SI_NGA_ILE_001]WNW13379.1 YqcC family protein [Pseudomonas sp. DTU_2021_1001937_2_SI_NGA_ILE_001]
MDKRVPALADQLLSIEQALRELGWWESSAPAPQALASQQPFCVDTLSFEQWLQWIFLPRMKAIVEQSLPLPSVSGIREMAEMVYVERPEQVRNLLASLSRFDQLIGKAG